jgi:hypothetical protein
MTSHTYRIQFMVEAYGPDGEVAYRYFDQRGYENLREAMRSIRRRHRHHRIRDEYIFKEEIHQTADDLDFFAVQGWYRVKPGEWRELTRYSIETLAKESLARM